jgi:hypothetical protein
VAILDKLFSLSQDHVQLMLIIAVALLVELGSSLGLYLASGHGAAKLSVPEPKAPSPLLPPEPEPRIVDVVDFVLDALVPVPGATLSIPELQEAYAGWCNRKGFEPLPAETFTQQFVALAKAVGLPSGKSGYSGIGHRPDRTMLAA